MGSTGIHGDLLWISWEVSEFMVIYIDLPIKNGFNGTKTISNGDLTLKNDRTIHGNNGDFMGFYDILWV